MKFRLLAILLTFSIFLVGCGVSEEISQIEDESTVEAREIEDEVAEDDEGNYEALTDRQLEVYAIEGDVEAQLELATRYDYGTSENGQDFGKAKEYYEMAASSGNATALRVLGYYYLEGLDSDVDLDLAVDYFLQAIEGGDVDAYVGIGRAYLAGYEGEGLSLGDEESTSDTLEDEETQEEQSEEEISTAESTALSYFETASALGSLSGGYYTAYLTEQMATEDADYSSAIAAYEELASLDKADLSIFDKYLVDAANTQLGMIYVVGRGVEVDYAVAMEYFMAASDYPQAQYCIGQLYENGYGVDVDYEEAVNWYLLAADADYAPALTQLGYMYYLGNGVEADLDQAIYYEKRAAMQGYAAAQINLGYLYENGIGVEQDLEVALSYYSMAAEQGSEGAEEAITRVQSLIEEENEVEIEETEE